MSTYLLRGASACTCHGVTLLLIGLAVAGCGASEAPASPGSLGATGGTPTGGLPAIGGTPLVIEPGAGGAGAVSGVIDLTMPADFTAAERGGWKLGEPVPAAATGSTDTVPGRTDACGTVLLGVVRDFTSQGNTETGHPDFGAGISNLVPGLVELALDANRKPVASALHASGLIESAESFGEWYRDSPAHNRPYYLELYLEPNGSVFSFTSHAFYPLDGQGFGDEWLEHNHHFTFELHTAFVYQGGEVFQFTGDDDLWVFINGRLAIDLGGVHDEASARVELDAAATDLGLTVGEAYALDFFHAERWCCESNFAIETTLAFTNCGTVPVVY